MRFPKPLSRGDALALVAPSSPFDVAQAMRGVAWLRQRYRVLSSRTLYARSGFFAGDDERRLSELNWALGSGVRAVVAMRGGYGLSRIVHRIDWKAFTHDPPWIVGFSDLTVLHVEAGRRGVASVHGPMVCALGRGRKAARRLFIDALEKPLAPRRFRGLLPWRGGAAAGPLFGGNLAVLHSCAAAGRLVVPEGSVLLLEDVGERPYRIDRMLTDLHAAGHFANVSAVVVGDFLDCSPGPDGRRVEQVLRERLTGLAIPVLAGLPIGHGPRNHPVTLGARATVDSSRKSLVIEGA